MFDRAAQPGGVRIAYVTESFPPDVNGVAHTAARVAEHLALLGHEPVVIAPRPSPSTGPPGLDDGRPYPVVRVPSADVPLYPGFRVGLPGQRLRQALTDCTPDLVHLAGPFVLGASAGKAARLMGLPTVAVYATDLAAYAQIYHLGRPGQSFSWRRLRQIHNAAGCTLAPSTATAAMLAGRGFQRVRVWARGVDTRRFDPAKRDGRLRAELAPHGEVIVGYVGRLAAEKCLGLLSGLAAAPGIRLVVTGGGPAEAAVRRALPGAVFLGQREGEELARIYASLDVFVHSGPYETFGNTLQEAAVSGLPVVAPAAGGPLDLVADGVTGLLVPPGDAGALTAAVVRLASDPALRARFSAAARRRAVGNGWPQACQALLGHYGSVLGVPAHEPVATTVAA
jgi:phosphatidylinositol alpha 1,6-mannosyltransferase